MVAIYLVNSAPTTPEGCSKVNVDFTFGVKGSDGKDVSNCSQKFESHVFADVENTWGFHNFASRSDILKALVEGTLLVEVRMRRNDAVEEMPFVAENPLRKLMLKLLNDEDSSDVIFEVEGKDEDGAEGPIKFYSHRLILMQCAPILHALCDTEDDAAEKVYIMDVKPHVFRLMLRYIYGDTLSEDELKTHAKDLIEAADRYEIVNLKLEAEAWYVRTTPITYKNTMELLLYSDAMNCALLKEAAMDFIIEHKAEVLEKVSLTEAPGGVLAELLAAAYRETKKKTSLGAAEVDFGSMRICDLRRRLHEKGLDIDGSREALIADLEGDLAQN